jgi:hypothetical protein
MCTPVRKSENGRKEREEMMLEMTSESRHVIDRRARRVRHELMN